MSHSKKHSRVKDETSKEEDVKMPEAFDGRERTWKKKKRELIAYLGRKQSRQKGVPLSMLFILMMTKILRLLMMPQNYSNVLPLWNDMPQNCSNVSPLWNDMVNTGKQTTLIFTTYWQYGQREVMLKCMLTPSSSNVMAEVHG